MYEPQTNCCGPGGACGPEGPARRLSENEVRLVYLERLGERAVRGLLLDRISQRLEKTQGRRLDRLADLTADMYQALRKTDRDEESARAEFLKRLEKIREEN